MRSIRPFVVILFSALLFAGCKKEEQVETLDEYVKRMNLTSSLTPDPRGFYYAIVTPGSGAAPNANSKVSVLYAGKLTNGTVFDQTGSTPVTFPLSNLVMGWQYGLPLIKVGGRILLYLPPQLGYGAQAVGSIPANSILIFDITLTGVQ